MDKPNYFAFIPAIVRYDEDLTPNSKLLFAEITALTQKEGVCWASDNYFTKLYNVKRQTVQRWLKELEDKGHIKREIVYKDGTKEVEKRYIRVYTGMLQGVSQNSDRGIHNIVTDNNTSINNTSINSISSETDSKDYSVHREIFDYWNEQGIIKHREFTQKRKSAINAKLEHYSKDEILETITIYNDILKDDKYYYTHRFSLEDFLVRSFDKFANRITAEMTYLNKYSKDTETVAEQIVKRGKNNLMEGI